MAAGKLAAGIASMTGAGSLGVLAGILARGGAAHSASAGLQAVIITVTVMATVVAGLALILGYRLQKTRLEMYRLVLEKAVGESADTVSYRELIVADAVHLSVEQSGAQTAGPRDRGHLGEGSGPGQ